MEVVTKICGVFAVWNRRTGECLRIGSGGVLLGNAPLSPEKLLERKKEGERLLEELRVNAQGDAKFILNSLG
jgi:hypothetical protein